MAECQSDQTRPSGQPTRRELMARVAAREAAAVGEDTAAAVRAEREAR